MAAAPLPAGDITGYRAVNSKFPPIELFDDVADADEFQYLYALQARTNPRLLNEIGRIELIPRSDIPFGIVGCSYAIAPFTHINPAGSRFSDGSFGVLYIADDINTALTEVAHHQGSYWARVEGIRYDRIVLRGLRCNFDAGGMFNASTLPVSDPIYDPQSYQAARQFGQKTRTSGFPGIQYHSVRSQGNTCWALFTPRPVKSIIQATHYEMIWDGQQIAGVNRLAAL